MVRISKGNKASLSIKKASPASFKVTLGWTGQTDLDAICFLLTAEDTVEEEADIVFYNSEKRVVPTKSGEFKFGEEGFNPSEYTRKEFRNKPNWRDVTYPISFDNAILGPHDERGDDEDDSNEQNEEIYINSGDIRPEIQEVVFAVAVFDEEGKTTFSDITDAYIKIENIDSDEELVLYELNEEDNEKLDTGSALIVGKLLLNDDDVWFFESDSYVSEENGYGIEQLIKEFASNFDTED